MNLLERLLISRDQEDTLKNYDEARLLDATHTALRLLVEAVRYSLPKGRRANLPNTNEVTLVFGSQEERVKYANALAAALADPDCRALIGGDDEPSN